MEWAHIKENARFYPQEGSPYEIPWDVRDATRAMHELQINE